MFHVAVENVKKENFFTEKIIDAFLTRTVPVYRGCTNLEQFFDMDGVITFDTEDELVEILNSLTEEDYLKRKEAMENNYKLALYWKDYYIRLVDVLEQIVNLNNI
jgi:ADP-ribosylglycohydrolase